MGKCRFFVSLAVSILLVVGFTTCKNPANQLTGLEISSPLDTTYTAGQFFDITDLVVTATYSNKGPANVTNQCSFEPGLTTPLTTAHTAIVISYTEDDFTLTAYHGITVSPAGGASVVTGVTVNPDTKQVQKGTSSTFAALVTGTNAPQTVTWTVEGGIPGTSISANGVLTVAAGETAATLTVKATSTANTGIFGTAIVTVTNEAVVTSIADITVTPSTIRVTKGSTHTFSAVVTGDNAPQTVTWTVEGGISGTSISANGLLIVAAGETAAMLTVKAASTVAGYTHVFGTAIVSVANPPAEGAVAVIPAAATVRRGETFQFSAAIAGNPSNDVIWSIPDNPWSVFGTTNISATGLLSVWAGDGSTTFTVRATSKADPAMFSDATVTLTF